MDIENEKKEENKINNESIPKEVNEIKLSEDFNEDDEIIKEEEIKRVDSGLDLTGDKNFEHMKEELDKAINFIDYFLVVGLPPKVFMESWLYQLDVDGLNEKFKDSFQPKVTSYFPNFEKHTIAFDDSVISHCFPNGFKAVISHRKPKIKVFSFILDNNYFNLNFPQKYLTCLICYENIMKYKELYDTYKQYMENEIKIENKENNNKINNDEKMINLKIIFSQKLFHLFLIMKNIQ